MSLKATPAVWTLRSKSLNVFYGCPQMPRLSHYFLPRLLLGAMPVLYLDGANQIAPLLIARFARERGRAPSEFNRLIRVARAFTCFQLTELIARAPDFLKAFPAQIVMVTALPDLYFDEDVREREARTAFERALESLLHPALRALSVAVFTDAATVQSPRHVFFRRLIASADDVVKVEPRLDGALTFTASKTTPRLRA
jgi:hypothetical protein